MFQILSLHVVYMLCVQTWYKPKCTVYMKKGSIWPYENYGVPSLYGEGYAKSDFTTVTCLLVPNRCWCSLGRSEQAVFRVLNFDLVCVLTGLAQASVSSRITQTGSNVA